ncbi:MAG: SAP domain-containing protein [Methanosphaera sp.]|nr:SAP domain-containing protein [Methanosphaera sp.]MEE3418496.1 SAP domain-containing protein [Methanosphaera sp.]
MVKYNCIIREDNIGKIISEDAMLDAVDIEETLRSKYIYLYNSIKETNYKLKVNHCTYFKEIVFKKKVVGFFAYTITNSVTNLSLIASYILPEFRGNGLFFDEINKIFEEGKELSIYYPPFFIMELLVKYGFAKTIDEKIIASSIKIDIPSNTISNIFGTDESDLNDLIFTSYLYDSELCGFLIIPEENSDILYLSNYYPEDDKKCSCSEKREKLDDSYIEEIKNTLKDNDEEIQDFLRNIRKNYSYYNDSNVESDEKIDFEKLKQININKKYNEDIFEGNTSIETYKNSILYNTEDIDKQEYIKTYLNVGIYDFIRIFNENNNFDLTNSIINIDYEFNADFIKNLVIKDGYISNELNSLEKENYLNSLTVNELKEILKRNNLTVTGNKSELISRIIEYVPSNFLPEKEYYVTEKGIVFINSHEDIDFYNKFLKNFYYYEFKKFIDENKGDITEVTELFLNKHLEISIDKRDNKAYKDSLKALAYLNALNNNIEQELHYELKQFIVGLNPIFRDERLYNYYQPINENNVENIRKILSENDFKIEYEFNKAWKSMEIKKFIIPSKKSLNILSQMISGEDRDYMNDKIREEYITKEKIIHDKLDKSKQSTLDLYF